MTEVEEALAAAERAQFRIAQVEAEADREQPIFAVDLPMVALERVK